MSKNTAIAAIEKGSQGTSLIGSVIYSGPACIEEWNKTFGGPDDYSGISVKQTRDGGYITVGEGWNSDISENCALAIKTDSKGNKLWEKSFFYGSHLQRFHSVDETKDGGYIIAGISNDSAILQKLDRRVLEGQEWAIPSWNKTFPQSSWFFSVQQVEDGGYITTGSLNRQLWLVKVDANGIPILNKTYYIDSCGSCGRFIQQTKDGGYIIAGDFFDCGIKLIKAKIGGAETWNRTFRKNRLWNRVYSVQQTRDGGYVAVGSANIRSPGLTEPNLGDLWLVKTDSEGNEILNRTFGEHNYYSAGFKESSIKEVVDGYVLMNTIKSPSSYDIWVAKTDFNGNLIWEEIFGSQNIDEIGRSLQETNDGGYIITGDKGSRLLLLKIKEVCRKPDLKILDIRHGSPAFTQSGKNVNLPIEVALENAGAKTSNKFKLSVDVIYPNGNKFYAPFSVAGQGDAEEPWLNGLASRKNVSISGNLTLRYDEPLYDKTVTLIVTADSCLGDEFMPEECRVPECDEKNNELRKAVKLTRSQPSLIRGGVLKPLQG